MAAMGDPVLDALARVGLAGKEKLVASVRARAEEIRRSKTPDSSTTSVDECWQWFWVPGRIEVLGKHTDYLGGESLLCCNKVKVSPRSGSMNHGRR